MRKQIKKIGNSAGIIFSLEEMKGYNLEVGDFVDISDLVKVVAKKKPQKKKKEKNPLDAAIRRMPQ